jgi:cyclic pyranopterin phosphate synthase
MLDSYGRNIEYLRLSLTDRCNLRCAYCRDASATPCDYELSPANVERIIKCMTALGITKVRLTGGEPLLRHDLEDIIAAISCHEAVCDICMTTNAHGLDSRAAALKKAGLMRINISLDSLNKDRFRTITGGGSVEQVFAGIDAALEAGLSPIKLNCVVIKGKNDDEVDDFVSLAREKPVHVRFIELMPMGGERNDDLRVANDALLALHPELSPLPTRFAGQPALEYSGDGFRGTVGFISPVTRPFCNACNRARVTPDGKLRPCLGDNMEADLITALEGDDESLLRIIERTIYNKPKGHRFNDGFVSERRMNRIGG